jgi:phosphorylated CTD-interacting factor 1
MAYWDFEAERNTRFRDPRPTGAAPRPDLEVLRAHELARLRTLWGQWCRDELGLTAPPKQALDRWLYGQLMTKAAACTTSDPLLKYPELATATEVLARELIKEMPASTYISWLSRNKTDRVAEVVQTYLEATEAWLKRQSQADLGLRSALDGTRALLGARSSDAAVLTEALETLSSRVQATMRDTMKTAIDRVMVRVVAEARAICEKLGTAGRPALGPGAPEPCSQTGNAPVSDSQKDGEIGADHAQPAPPGAQEPAAGGDDGEDGEIREDGEEGELLGFPADLPLEAAQEVQLAQERSGTVALSFGAEVQRLRGLHFDKLCQLFALHNPGASEGLRNAVLFCVLRRYNTLFGPNAFETAAMHAALPEFGFQLLHRRMGICYENYASPFNCFFSQFNSAFADTDAWLGSHGSFADSFPVEGSFETGPPYTEEAMTEMAVHLEELLTASERPLSFLVFVPDWRQPLQDAQRLLEDSDFLQDDLVLKGRSYSYVVGHQHQPDERADQRYFELPFDTHLYILQNKAGAARWPCSGVLRDLQLELERTASIGRPPTKRPFSNAQRGWGQGRNAADAHNRSHAPPKRSRDGSL